MRVLIWIFIGLAAAAITAAIRGDRGAKQLVFTAVVGVVGAVVGGLLGRLVAVGDNASPSSGGFAIVVGAVVALAVQHVLASGRRRAPLRV